MEKQRKAGRPQGSKSIGIPLKGIKEAIALIKMAYEKRGVGIMSFSEATEFMHLQKGSNTATIGALKQYGLIDSNEYGYMITDIGKRAVEGDKSAVKDAFERNALFKDLSNQFFDKDFSEGVIIDYLKKKYKKGENTTLIAQRFIEGVNYIKSLQSIEEPKFQQKETKDYINKLILLLQLRYAFLPTEKLDKEILIQKSYEQFRDDKISGVKTTIESIKENKNDDKILKVLINNLIDMLSKEYPALKIDEKKIEKSTS